MRGLALLRAGQLDRLVGLGDGDGPPGTDRRGHRACGASRRRLATGSALPRPPGWALARSGRVDAARTVLDEMRGRPAAAPTAVSEAWLLGALGEIDAAFVVLARAEAECQPFLYTPVSPPSIRSVPTRGSRRCWRGWSPRGRDELNGRRRWSNSHVLHASRQGERFARSLRRDGRARSAVVPDGARPERRASTGRRW